MINKKQEELGDLVDIEVAGLLVAREIGCNIDSIYDRVFDKVFGTGEKST
jgi:hypothetical protein